MDVGVVGGSGYGGAELLRVLAQHPAFKVRAVAGRSTAGAELSTVFPSLGLTGAIVAVDTADLARCDVVFLATPHEASLELAPALVDGGALVVDLSGAFRLAPEVFAAWYGQPHSAPAWAPAPYGLPELFREDLPGARLVAGPGCYPTAALLALAPLVGLVDPESVVVTGLSGTSGAGKGLRDDLHHSHATANVAPYGAPRHRHTPEIAAGWGRLVAATATTTANAVDAANPRNLGFRTPPRRGKPKLGGRSAGAAAVTFVPHLVPMARGLVCTVTATLLEGGSADIHAVRAAFVDRYATERFVTVLPEGTWPQTAHLTGSNAAHVAVAVDRDAGRVVASCALDNLGKGAAGQAIQAANVALGLDEGAGLPIAGVYP